MDAKVKIDWTKNTVTIEAPITPLQMSSTGQTESMVNIKNEAVGIAHPDGRQVKMSLLLYVKRPKT